MIKNKTFLGYILTAITVIIWGLDNIFFKDILNYISPNNAILVRFLTVTITMSIVMIIKRQKVDKKIINNRYSITIFIMALILTSYYMLLSYGLSISKATLVEFVNCGLGALVSIVVLSIFIPEERKILFRKTTILSLIIVTIGAYLTSNTSGLLDFSLDLGVILAIISTFIFASYTMIFTKISHDIPVTKIMRDMSFICCIVVMILLIFTKELNLLLSIDKLILIKLVVISLIVDVGSIFTFYKAIRLISGVRVNILTLLCPVITFNVAYIFLHEKITNLQLIGCILLLLASGIISVKDYIDYKNKKSDYNTLEDI